MELSASTTLWNIYVFNNDGNVRDIFIRHETTFIENIFQDQSLQNNLTVTVGLLAYNSAILALVSKGFLERRKHSS